MSHFFPSTEKKEQNIWELGLNYYLGQNKDDSLGSSISDSPEKLLQIGRGEVSVTYDFSEGGYMQWAHSLAEACCLSGGAGVTMNDFSAFLDTRQCKNCTIKLPIKSPENIYRKTCSSIFSQSTKCLSPHLHSEFLLGTGKV